MKTFTTPASTNSSQQCFECGAKAECRHHVVPRSRGGKRTVLLCGMCHAKAHHSSHNMAHSTLTKAALAAKRNANQRTGGIPFGYRLADDGLTLVPVPAELEVILKIIASSKAGMSLRGVAKALNDAATPTKRGGKRWHASTVSGVIRRQAATK